MRKLPALLATLAMKGLWWLLRHTLRPLLHPTLTLPLIAVLSAFSTLADRPLISAMFLVPAAGLLIAWRVRYPDSFTRHVAGTVRAWWCRWFRYGLGWRFWMGRCALTLEDERTGQSIRPRLVRVRCTPALDRLLLDLPAGFAPDDIVNRSEYIAHALRADEARVRRDQRPRRVWIDLLRRDPLREPIPAMPIPDQLNVEDLDGLVIGRGEDGQPWRLRIRGNHVFIAGVSGAGKGSVLWSVLRALAPFIKTGLVVVYGIDPKGGMELEFGREMFARYERDDLDGMVDLLEDAVIEMDARCRLLRGETRAFTPSTATPLVLLVVDELASMTALGDAKTTRRVEAALGKLLTKGRAPGFAVIAAVQDPAKDVVRWRNLFPTKIALRLDTDTQVTMVLGEGARDRGAYADRIPPSLPGVGYVHIEGRKEPARVRAAYVNDGDIRDMATRYPAPPSVRVLKDAEAPA